MVTEARKPPKITRRTCEGLGGPYCTALDYALGTLEDNGRGGISRMVTVRLTEDFFRLRGIAWRPLRKADGPGIVLRFCPFCGVSLERGEDGIPLDGNTLEALDPNGNTHATADSGQESSQQQ